MPIIRRLEWQDRPQLASLSCFIFPEDRDNAKRLLLFNQAGQIVTENLAENFVRHGRVGLGASANSGHRAGELGTSLFVCFVCFVVMLVRRIV
jgi:hypothetical protein